MFYVLCAAVPPKNVSKDKRNTDRTDHTDCGICDIELTRDASDISMIFPIRHEVELNFQIPLGLLRKVDVQVTQGRISSYLMKSDPKRHVIKINVLKKRIYFSYNDLRMLNTFFGNTFARWVPFPSTFSNVDSASSLWDRRLAFPTWWCRLDFNPDAIQMLGSWACAFIFRSRWFREGIIGKGGKMSGVGGISRARLPGVSLLRLCPSLSLCFAHTCARITAFNFFFTPAHPRAMHRVTRKTDGFACVFAFDPARMHVPRRGFPRFQSSGGRISDLRRCFSHGKSRNQCAPARKRARRKLIDLANAQRQAREIDLTRLNSRRGEEVTCMLIVNRLLF